MDGRIKVDLIPVTKPLNQSRNQIKVIILQLVVLFIAVVIITFSLFAIYLTGLGIVANIILFNNGFIVSNFITNLWTTFTGIILFATCRVIAHLVKNFNDRLL